MRTTTADRDDLVRLTDRYRRELIAGNTCVTALEGRACRPLLAGLGGPAEVSEEPLRAPVTDFPRSRSLPDALDRSGLPEEPS
ncbi:hypothetical protein [Streptomyces sp. NPDC055013]